MQMRIALSNCRGTILIVTLWILAILTVFAVALGQRASLEVKLAEYQRDKLKAVELTKAAIERAILEKENDPLVEVDALSESWANNQAAFQDFELGEEAFTGTFTVSYSLDGTTLYGMEDEEGKININEVEPQVLVNLLEECEVENADQLATSILVWAGKITDPGIIADEEAYYETLDLPYPCKQEQLQSIAELLLVQHITPEILYGEDRDGDGKIAEDEQGIAQYLTVYGAGKVNINTASEKVLSALIGGNLPDLGTGDDDLVVEIVDFRKGDDGEIGTSDDNWFSAGVTVDNLEGIPTKDLAAGTNSLVPFFDVDSAQWAKLKDLVGNDKLSVSSTTYTIHAQAELNKVKKSITATIDLSAPDEITYLFWQRN